MKKFDAIESLRGYMAWWVVLGHAIQLAGRPEWLPQAAAEWLTSANMAVQVFMIVSGFVIAHLLISREERYDAYIARRFFRLAPLYFFLVIAAILIRDLYATAFIANPWTADAPMRVERLAEEAQRWPVHVGLHLTMLHGLLPDTLLPFSSSTFLAPAWSLSLEWQFYLLAPLLLAGLSSLRRAWIIAAAIALAGLAYSKLFGTWRYESFLPLALPFFFGGIASRLLLEKRLPWLAIASTALVTLLYLLLLGHWHFWKLLPVAAIWTIFLAVTARESEIISIKGRWLDGVVWMLALNPVAKALGQVSYSTYLCHIPVFSIVVGGGMLMTGRSDHGTIYLLTGIGLAATVAASFLLYHYVEQPGIRFGSRWVKRRAVDELAAA